MHPFLSRFKRRFLNECYRRIFETCIDASKDGFLARGPGNHFYKVYPRLWAFMLDYEEAILVTGIKKNRCPSCMIPSEGLSELEPNEPFPRRSMDVVRQLLDHAYSRGFTASKIEKKLDDWGWPVDPTTNWAARWRGSDIYRAVMCDILHQVLKGVAKHMFDWIEELMNIDKTVMDRYVQRCHAVPKQHGKKKFGKPLYSYQQLNGYDFKMILRTWVVLLNGLPFPALAEVNVKKSRTTTDKVTGEKSIAYYGDPTRCRAYTAEEVHDMVLASVRHFVNFYFLISTKTITDDGLNYMREALEGLRDNSPVFLRFCKTKFEFPKWHSQLHYIESTILNGTATNYTTDYSEKQHIRDCKVAYAAGNKRNIEETQIRHVRRRLAAFERGRRIDHLGHMDMDLNLPEDTSTPAGKPAEKKDHKDDHMGNEPRVRKIGVTLGLAVNKNGSSFNRVDDTVGTTGMQLAIRRHLWMWHAVKDPKDYRKNPDDEEEVVDWNAEVLKIAENDLPFPNQASVKLYQGLRVTYASVQNDADREWELIRCHAKASSHTKALKTDSRTDNVLIRAPNKTGEQGANRYVFGRLKAVATMKVGSEENKTLKEIQLAIVQIYRPAKPSGNTAAKRSRDAASLQRLEKSTGMLVLDEAKEYECVPVQWIERSCHLVPVWQDANAARAASSLVRNVKWYLVNHHSDRWCYWSLYI